MDFFGLTSYGVERPVKDLVRPDYHEPAKQPKSLLLSENKKLTLVEKMRELDPHIGTADGFAYKSINRLKVMKRKRMLKPVGPTEMYHCPGAASMVIGWWNSDPILKGSQWFRPRKMFPYPSSDMSKYKEEMGKNRSIWVIV